MKDWLGVAVAGTAMSAMIMLYGCANNDANKPSDNVIVPQNTAPVSMGYVVVNILPHDSTAFTQGFLFRDGRFYEGTGAPANTHYTSSIRISDPKTGVIEKKIEQGTAFFGEGITILDNLLYQLTWQNKKIFVYDANTLTKIKEYDWNGEGWGIANDGKQLFISDGTSNIAVVDPTTMRVVQLIHIYDHNGPVDNINELEYIDGYLYANQWETNYILKIDLSTGKVVGRADFEGILATNTRENLNQIKYQNKDAVLNGIAYDSTSKSIYITGKLWPHIFEIKWQ